MTRHPNPCAKGEGKGTAEAKAKAKTETKNENETENKTSTEAVRSGARTIIVGACYALVALLLLAALAWYVTSRPVGTEVPPKPWKISTNDQLVLYPRAGASLLTILGADKEGIDVRFDSARLDDATLRSLRTDFNLALPESSGPIAWTTAAAGTGHTTIDIALQDGQRAPQVDIANTQEGPDSGLSIRAHGAQMVVHLSVLLGGGRGATPVVEQKALRIADREPVILPGPVPLTIVVQEDRPLKLIFPSSKLASTFRLGIEDSTENESGLPLRGAAVRPIGGDADVLYACAARGGEDYWRLGAPTIDDCATDGRLRATQIDLERDSVAVTVHGSAWFASDGDFITDQRYNKYVSSNLVFSALATAIVGALCAIVVTAVFGRRQEP
jgi:hypothetical protein